MDTSGLTLGMSISIYLLIFCYRNSVIFYCKSGETAERPIELLCSIVLAGGDQIDEGLEGLDGPAKSVGNFGGYLICMRDCLKE